MTREEQINGALALLAPSPGNMKRYRQEIREALDQIEKMMRMLDSDRPSKRKLDDHIKALKNARATSPAPDPEFTAYIDARIAHFERLYLPEFDRTPPKRGGPHNRAPRQKFAVIEAEGLLIRLGFKPTVSRSHRSQWFKLSAILFGDPKANLYNHLREVRSL